MPLRKHFILHDGKRRFVNDMAWFRLRQKMITAGMPTAAMTGEAGQYYATCVLYADANVEVPRMNRPKTAPKWRKEITAFATALYDAGHTVDLRIFHSRKHARPSRSKLHAVRTAA